MPRTMPMNAALLHLPEIVAGMQPGEELALTSNGATVAIVTVPERESGPRVAGTAKDHPLWMAPDFNAPLEDFAEYME